MASLFDLLMNKGKNIKENVSNLYNKITNNDVQVPKIEAVVQSVEQPENPIANLAYQNRITPLNGAERFFGRTMTKDISSSEPNKDGTYEMTTISDFRPGLLNDLASGFKENRWSPVEINNFSDNMTDDGRRKGIAFRIGEGLGSLKRFADKPLGRGLITAGLIGATGGTIDDALAFGVNTAAQNQQYRNADRLYRNSLIDAEQNSLLSDKEFQQLPLEMKQQMLNEVANKYNNIKGYINPQTFNALLQAKQLQDNAEYRKMYYDNQQKQNEALEKLNRQKFEYQQKQDAIENAQKWAQIENAKDKGNAKEEAKRKQSQSTLNMIDSALEVVKNNPKAFGFIKGITPADITNRADLEGAKARAMIDSLAAEYRKYLTGAQMTEQERKHYERFLPNPRDNAQIIARKLVGMQETISAREGLFEKSDTQSLNIDTNAIDAELKKRGIK